MRPDSRDVVAAETGRSLEEVRTRTAVPIDEAPA